jgi:hypothetical protein
MKRKEYGASHALDRPFRLGFRVGVCLLLLAWIFWDVAVDYGIFRKKKGLFFKTKKHRAHSPSLFF